MQSNLERITIKGLHGNKTIDAHLRDNTLVLVGENGAGKTTFLRILYYAMSGQWRPLLQNKFASITLSIGGEEHEISYDLLRKIFAKTDRKLLHDLSSVDRARLMELIERKEIYSAQELDQLLRNHDIPYSTAMAIIDPRERMRSEELDTKIATIMEAIDAQILYLPTYRRIEQELSRVLKGIEPENYRRSRQLSISSETSEVYVELVEFGMQDVKKAIDTMLESLKDFARENLNSLTLGYLGNVVDKEYLSVGMDEIASASEETIQSVLDRIPENILSQTHKEHLFNVINTARFSDSPDEHGKIICHYFLKLLDFQERLQEKEYQISAFCKLCSDYMVDKYFHYDSTKFTFSILPRDKNVDVKDIELRDLSSGEKQIVSLFSHLYLSGNKRYFVLIDEPELSLSVPWQRRFLADIRRGDFCAGLIAATHSPFVYENELKKYTHALGEFISLDEVR